MGRTMFLILVVASMWSTKLHGQGVSEWVAYNDLQSEGPGDGNAPNVTRYTYQTEGGVLIDFATGADLPISVTGSIVVGTDPTPNGGGFSGGTNGGHVFGNVVDPAGSYELDTPDWRHVVTFDNLDATKTYTVALTANRNNGAYAGARFTRVTLEGADTFVNASTPGVVVHSEASV